MKSCLFCINLRTATLLLATMGFVSHLYGAIALQSMWNDVVDNTTLAAFSFYSVISALACLMGLIGVKNNNVKHLQIFSNFYWIDFALHTMFAIGSTVLLFNLDTEICKSMIEEGAVEDMDMETCQEAYRMACYVLTAMVSVSMLFKLHFSFAIHSYVRQVKQQLLEGNYKDYVVISSPQALYPEPRFVAGKEFIPDEKK